MSGSRRRSSRLAASGALAAALALGALGARPLAAQPPASFLAADGHAWRGLSEGEKLALLTGFLVGGVLEHGLRLSPGEAPPPPEALEALRREGRVRFPYAPAVYKARLEDFYFYQDRLPVPVYRALFLINEELRRGALPR